MRQLRSVGGIDEGGLDMLMNRQSESRGQTYRIGVIADTHNVLPSGLAWALGEVELILHAGDVTSSEVFQELEKIAPVKAVRGNMDREGWAQSLPSTRVVEIGEVQIYMLHDLYLLDFDPRSAGFAMVVTGHTHQPQLEEIDGVLYLNPGSAGASRTSQPPSLAMVEIEGRDIRAELVYLAEG
jgi:putative phosphoesterase